MLWSDIIFGPIHSRRLGISLGVNLLPLQRKICSFNCIYCECGLNEKGLSPKLPMREAVKEKLKERLSQMNEKGEYPDSISFTGNGEPTLHPEFARIIDDTIMLRNQYAPQCKISVLSNATRIQDEEVFHALQKVDNNILKLDAVEQGLFERINQPNAGILSKDIIERLSNFKGNFILQTMFLKGEVNGKSVDNTTTENVQQWVEVVRKISPKKVMIYTIDRPTPYATLQKVSPEELRRIASLLEGFEVDIAE